MVDNGRGRGSPNPGLEPEQQTPAPTRTITESLPHRDDRERARQVQRLAAMELIRLLYGPAADLPPSPVGSAVCPASCPYCPPTRKEQVA